MQSPPPGIPDPGAAESPPVPLPARYRFEAVLGQGVLPLIKAYDSQSRIFVAIRLFAHDRACADPKRIAGFRAVLRREAIAGARMLPSPHVVRVYGHESDQHGNVFVIMEYIPGGTLSDGQRTTPAFPLAVALRFISDAARGLADLHAAHLVHRDVRPSNLFLSAEGRVKVGDLKSVQIGTAVFDARLADDILFEHPRALIYVSPEEQRTTFPTATPATDQYALGCVLFELLTAERYLVLRPAERMARLTALPTDVAAVIQRMTALRPEDRYPAMADVAAAAEGAREQVLAEAARGVVTDPEKDPLVVCPTCHREIDSRLQTCPWCGTSLGKADAAQPQGAAAFSPIARQVSTRASVLTARVLDRYRVTSVLGGGGLSRVFLAYDTRMRRYVAIKTSTQAVRANESQAAWAERHIHQAAIVGGQLVGHAHIVGMLDLAADADGVYYLIEEYLPGGTLLDRLRNDGAMPLADALRVAADIANALQAVHGHTFVHRNVKPANILFTADGRAKLGGFSMAQVDNDHPEGSDHPGTPVYMSPEQWHSRAAIDGRSDLYSLGLVLFEMVTGVRYHGQIVSKSSYDTMFAQAPTEHERLLSTVPPKVDALIRRMIAVDPAARFPTAAVVEAECLALRYASDQTS